MQCNYTNLTYGLNRSWRFSREVITTCSTFPTQNKSFVGCNAIAPKNVETQMNSDVLTRMNAYIYPCLFGFFYLCCNQGAPHSLRVLSALPDKAKRPSELNATVIQT